MCIGPLQQELGCGAKMLFPTVEFALFFLAVLLVAWSLHRLNGAHKLFLLLASYLFYVFWDWSYVPLLFVISLVSGIAAQRIQANEVQKVRKTILISGIVICLSTLAYF